MQNRTLALLTLLYLLGNSNWRAGFAAEEARLLCSRYKVIGANSLDLSDDERRLLCGDSEVKAWSQIPDNQAMLSLKAFLQQRGYFQPKITIGRELIEVDIGEKTLVQKLTLKQEPEDFQASRLRGIIGETLTPKLLNEVTQRLTHRLETMGYPCSKVAVEASYLNGEIVGHLHPGPLQNFYSVTQEPVEGLDDNLFERYHAFRLGDRFNKDLLSLTAQRVLDENVVQSTHFTTECPKVGARVTQHFVAGPSRLVTVALGLDTERGLLARTTWRNVRLGRRASSLQLAAEAAFNQQKITADSLWYALPFLSRFYLHPTIEFRHEDIVPYENLLSKVQLFPTTTLDTSALGFTFYGGPTFTAVKTYRGEGPDDSQLISWGLGAQVKTHEFEFYRTSPREGFEIAFHTEFTKEGFLSNVSAQRITLRADYLWNLGNFDPPFIVVGWRGQVETTLVAEDPEYLKRLPVDFRFYAGGSPDLRGFSYQQLPPGGKGALSSFKTSLEVRFADLLPWKLQPFVFADLGLMGDRPVTLNLPAFWSPGFGIRWESPIGTIRSSLAHGFFAKDRGIDPQYSHWQFYFSFGEEF